MSSARRAALIRTAVGAWLFAAAFQALACTVSASGVSFGSFDPLENVAVESAGDVTVTCSPSASYTVELSTGGAGSFSPREMTGPESRTLQYNLYLDASRAIVWGDGNGGTSTVEGSDDGTGTTHTVYGKIPSGQNPYVGSYSDSVTVTVIY